MKSKVKARAPHVRNWKQFHWTIAYAAKEFGLDFKTLAAHLKRASIEPAFMDKTFSTRQICAAVFSDKTAEQTGLLKEQKEIAAIKKAVLLGKLLPDEMVEFGLDAFIVEVRTILSFLPISDASKAEFLKKLSVITIREYMRNYKPSGEIQPNSGIQGSAAI